MKQHIFTEQQLKNILKDYKTPFHIYDEQGLRESIKSLNTAFKSQFGEDNFKEFFAVKGLPNPHILKIFKEEGCGTDCSSEAELILSEKTDIVGEDIMFTSNNTPIEEYQRAYDLGAIINLDDISHIPFLFDNVGIPQIISFRYNPGSLKTGNSIIGNPVEAKYGLTHEQIIEAYKICKDKGVKRFGIHTMVASNELNSDYFAETAHILFELVAEIHNKTDIEFEFINLGGGIGVAYKPEEKPVDFYKLAEKIKEYYDKTFQKLQFKPKIFMENARVLTGPNGYLITKAIHYKNTYKNYIGVDSSMANLMRPGLYGAYHHISVMGKEDKPHNHTYDIVGSLCENNDKFAIDRKLPEIETGDILIIHDTGAHGHAMGFNYNGKLRSQEVLLKLDGSTKSIRRAETLDDYFATIDFNSL